MAGPVQSIERAAAILRLLASGPRRLGLGEVAASLGLAKGTTHGILRTLQNLDFVEQWLTRHALGTGWNVHVTNVTAGYASINVAGPEARSTLTKLTSLDLSPAAFPYMGFAQGEVR